MCGNKGERKRRVLISHQGCIPIYRKSFFERLNALGQFDYVVVHGAAPRGTNYILADPPFNFPNIKINNKELPFLDRSIIWQPIVWRVLRGDFDAAVIGSELKFISNLFIVAAMLVRRRPLLMWGFGFHQYLERPRTRRDKSIAKTAGAIITQLYRAMSGFLVYTEGGKRALLNLSHPPKRIAVLGNTIDVERESSFRAIVKSEPIERVFLELGTRASSTKLLYFGRLVKLKHLEILVDYARRCAGNGREVDVIIFGAGPQEAELKASACDLRNVVFHAHDDLKLARALRISTAIVVPGYVGLAVPHGFAHGVPTLTRAGQQHGPEVEYILNGENGLILPEDTDQFYMALDGFLDDKPLQKRLASGAAKSAGALTMDSMVGAFHGLVADCLK
jgi:glycosyltransferase involved in cell wall biosynthesis